MVFKRLNTKVVERTSNLIKNRKQLLIFFIVLVLSFLFSVLLFAQEQTSSVENQSDKYEVIQEGQKPAKVTYIPAKKPTRPSVENKISSDLNANEIPDEIIEFGRLVEAEIGEVIPEAEHKIKAGDTVFTLLKQRGYVNKGRISNEVMAKVKESNPKIKNLNVLKVGELLILPQNLPASEREKKTIAKTAESALNKNEPQVADNENQTTLPNQNTRAEFGESADGVKYKTIKVKSGDTLERILRQEGLSADLIYQHLLKITVDLNDNLKNPDVIGVGMELKIPIQGEYLAKYKTQKTRAKTQLAKVDKKVATATSKSQSISSKVDKKTAKEPILPKMPSARSQVAKSALRLIFSRLGEQVNSSSHLYLPVSQGAPIELDTSVYPILELNNGHRIILDIDDQLPKSLVESLESKYDYYKIFKAQKNETLDQMLDRLWVLANYYKVQKKGHPFDGGQDIKLHLESDWLIWADSRAWAEGRPALINLMSEPTATTPEVWHNFLADSGIKVIDFYSKEGLLGKDVEAGISARKDKKLKINTLNAEKPLELTDNIFKMLGQTYKKGANVNMETSGAGYSMKVDAPFVVEKDQQKTIFEFGEVPREIANTLKQQGYQVVSLPNDPNEIIKSLLSFQGVDFKDNFVISNKSGKGPTVSLTIKGFYFTNEQGSYFLTDVKIPEIIEPLLNDSEVKVFYYGKVS